MLYCFCYPECHSWPYCHPPLNSGCHQQKNIVSISPPLWIWAGILTRFEQYKWQRHCTMSEKAFQLPHKHSFLESSHHAVRKPKTAQGEWEAQASPRHSSLCQVSPAEATYNSDEPSPASSAQFAGLSKWTVVVVLSYYTLRWFTMQ